MRIPPLEEIGLVAIEIPVQRVDPFALTSLYLALPNLVRSLGDRPRKPQASISELLPSPDEILHLRWTHGDGMRCCGSTCGT